MNWRYLISADERVCHGETCFTGTRVPVSAVLDNLAAGIPAEEVLTSYPSLDQRHLRAALAWDQERGPGSDIPEEVGDRLTE